MGRMKGGIALEKPPGGAAQGQGDQAGGAGGGAGGVPPDHRVPGERAIQPLHPAGLQAGPVLRHHH